MLNGYPLFGTGLIIATAQGRGGRDRDQRFPPRTERDGDTTEGQHGYSYRESTRLYDSPGKEVRPRARLTLDGHILADMHPYLLGARNRLRFPTIESLTRSCIPVSCGRTANSARLPVDPKISLSPVPSSDTGHLARDCDRPFHIPSPMHDF